MEMNFCRRCGTTLSSDDGHTFRCDNDHLVFKNATPTAGIFILTPDGQVLLGRRAVEPYKGTLDCIGGFLDEKETFEQSLAREIREECGLEPNEYGPLHYLCSAYDNYHYGDEDIPVVSSMFWARLATNRPITASDDINEIVICPINLETLKQIGAHDISTGFQALIDRKDETMKA